MHEDCGLDAVHLIVAVPTLKNRTHLLDILALLLLKLFHSNSLWDVDDPWRKVSRNDVNDILQDASPIFNRNFLIPSDQLFDRLF